MQKRRQEQEEYLGRFKSKIYYESTKHRRNIKTSIYEKARAIDKIFIVRLRRSVKYEKVYFQAYNDAI